MLIVEVDSIGPKAPERAFDHLLDVVWVAVVTAGLDVITELRSNGDLVSNRLQSLAN
jgi:hypothetical protein